MTGRKRHATADATGGDEVPSDAPGFIIPMSAAAEMRATDLRQSKRVRVDPIRIAAAAAAATDPTTTTMTTPTVTTTTTTTTTPMDSTDNKDGPRCAPADDDDDGSEGRGSDEVVVAAACDVCADICKLLPSYEARESCRACHELSRDAASRIFDKLDFGVRAGIWLVAGRFLLLHNDVYSRGSRCLHEGVRLVAQQETNRPSLCATEIGLPMRRKTQVDAGVPPRGAPPLDSNILTAAEVDTLTASAADGAAAQDALREWLGTPSTGLTNASPHVRALAAKSFWAERLRKSWSRWWEAYRARRVGGGSAAEPVDQFGRAEQARRLFARVLALGGDKLDTVAACVVLEWMSAHVGTTCAYFPARLQPQSSVGQAASVCRLGAVTRGVARAKHLKALARAWRLRRDAALRAPEGLFVVIDCRIARAVSVRVPCYVYVRAESRCAIHPPNTEDRCYAWNACDDSCREQCGRDGERAPPQCGRDGERAPPSELAPLFARRAGVCDAAVHSVRFLRMCPEAARAAALLGDALWNGAPLLPSAGSAVSPRDAGVGTLDAPAGLGAPPVALSDTPAALAVGEWRAPEALGKLSARRLQEQAGAARTALAQLLRCFALPQLEATRCLHTALPTVVGAFDALSALLGEHPTAAPPAAPSRLPDESAGALRTAIERHIDDTCDAATALIAHGRAVASAEELAELRTRWLEICTCEFALTSVKGRMQVTRTAVVPQLPTVLGLEDDDRAVAIHDMNSGRDLEPAMATLCNGGDDRKASMPSISKGEEDGDEDVEVGERVLTCSQRLLSRSVWAELVGGTVLVPSLVGVVLMYLGYSRGPSQAVVAAQLRVTPTTAFEVATLTKRSFREPILSDDETDTDDDDD